MNPDELVADYLARVRAAAGGLNPGRREELIEDLREHIATARAELTPETEAGVRTLLDRLGDPAVIVAEAASGEPPAAPPPMVAPRSNRVPVTILVVVLALCAAVPIVGCIGALLFGLPVSSETGVPGPVVSVEAPTPRPTSNPAELD